MTDKTANLIFPCGAKLPVKPGTFAYIIALQESSNLPFGLCVYHTINRPDRPILEQYSCKAPLPAPCISGCPAKGAHRQFNRLDDVNEFRSLVFCQPVREESAALTVEKRKNQ